MGDTPTSKLSFGRRALFMLIALAIGILMVEGAARLAWAVQFSDEEDENLQAFLGIESTWNPNVVSNYLPHHYLIYALNPRAQWQNAKFANGQPQRFVNSLGFRGREISREKPKGTFRIVCMGGSTTFGLSEYDERQTYPALLEGILSSWYEMPKFEVINAGTPGWTSAESLVNLLFRVLELEPDMIVTYEGVNDTFAMRANDEGMSDYSKFRRRVLFPEPSEITRTLISVSVFVRYAYYVSVGPGNVALDINGLASKPKPSHAEQNLDRATGKYFRRNLEQMVIIAKGNGIQPVLVTMAHGDWHPSIGLTAQITREVAASAGALLVDLEPASKQEWFLEDNIHLTRDGNLALASAVAHAIARTRPPFLPRPVAPP